MADTDLGVNIFSRFDGRGFKDAEQAAKVLERELRKREAAAQRAGQIEEQAYRENAARAARAARAEEEAAQRRMDALEGVGRASIAAGLVVAAGLGLSAKAAIDWETAFAGVRKTVDGTDEELAVVEQQFRSLARTLPASHQELAAVGEAAGQLGVRRDQLITFTRAAVDLGETTNLSAEEAATALAQLGNIYGITGARAGEMGDNTQRAGAALVALGNNGASTERDIVSMGLRIAGAGRQIGLSQAQVLGFASALSSVGIESEAGGSAISRVFLNIKSAVDTGGDSLETFAAVSGMTAEQFTRQYERDAAGAVVAFVEGLGQVEARGGSTIQVLDDLGLSEIRVRDALLRTSQASTLLRDSVDLGSDAWQENNALVEEAAQRYETAESRIQVARNQLNDAAIDIGGVVVPAIAGVAERAGVMAETFARLPGPVQDSVAVLGAATAAALLLAGTAAVTVPAVDRLKISLLDLGRVRAATAVGQVAGVLTGPWGLAIAGGVTLLGLFAESQFRADQRAKELRSTLDAQTGAVTENTRAKQAAQLQDEGLLDVAERLGLSLETVGQAATGNADALERVRAATEVTAQGTGALAGAQGDLLNLYGDASGVIQEVTAETDADAAAKTNLRNRVEELAEQTRRATGDQEQLSSAVGTSADASTTAAAAAGELAGGIDLTGQAAEQAQQDLEDLIRTFDDMAGAQLNAREAARGHLDAIAQYEEQLAAAVKENGEAARTLDTATEAGRRNQDALDAIAASANRQTESMLRNGAAHDDVVGSVDAARDAFSRAARAAGMGADEADALAKKLIAVPDQTTATVTVEGAAAARKAADDVRAALQRIDRNIVVTYSSRYGVMVRPPGGGGAVPERAEGGWTPPGWTLVGERGPELVDFRSPARVYSAENTRSLQQSFVGPRPEQALRPAPPGPAGGAVAVRVFIGDRELTDMIRSEVDDSAAQTAAAVQYGRVR